MSLHLSIAAELGRIASQGRGRLQVDVGTGNLESMIAAVDAIGVAFESFAFTTPKLAGVSIARVKQVSALLSAKLNYLLEPISPIESDAETCTVQMRSSPPRQGEQGIVYYELLVKRGGSLSLQRYQAKPGQMRLPIASQVTREVFERLVDDFVAAVA